MTQEEIVALIRVRQEHYAKIFRPAKSHEENPLAFERACTCYTELECLCTLIEKGTP